jgi:hypothetical protein
MPSDHGKPSTAAEIAAPRENLPQRRFGGACAGLALRQRRGANIAYSAQWKPHGSFESRSA